MTRLRFVLKDDSIPDQENVKAINGVKGVMNQGGQYQVIIGTHVSEVVKDVRKAAGISDGDAAPAETPKDTNLWNRFFKTISGCIMPMLGPMIAGGIIKGILTILTTFGVLTNTDGTYLILYAAADSVIVQKAFADILDACSVVKLKELGEKLSGMRAIKLDKEIPDLVAGVYERDGKRLYMFFNENVGTAIHADAYLDTEGHICRYDAMTDSLYKAGDADGSIRLDLEPYESSVFVVSKRKTDWAQKMYWKRTVRFMMITESTISESILSRWGKQWKMALT